MQSIARKNASIAGKYSSRFQGPQSDVRSVGQYGGGSIKRNGRGLIMPRKHKNARRWKRPKKLKIEAEPKVKIYSWPKKFVGDIYPGRVVAIAEPKVVRL
jgi:hypothetical protein